LLAADERLGDGQDGRQRRERGELRDEARPPGPVAVGGQDALEDLAPEEHEAGEPGRGERLDQEDGDELAAAGGPDEPQRAGDDARELAAGAVCCRPSGGRRW
jgi:hypothetical protein